MNLMNCCMCQGQPFLEQLILLNLEWMLEVEENVDTWTSSADKDWPESSLLPHGKSAQTCRRKCPEVQKLYLNP